MELNDSHLGKKEYWDKIYITELDNFKNNKDDVGKVCNIYIAVRYHHVNIAVSSVSGTI